MLTDLNRKQQGPARILIFSGFGLACGFVNATSAFSKPFVAESAVQCHDRRHAPDYRRRPGSPICRRRAGAVGETPANAPRLREGCDLGISLALVSALPSVYRTGGDAGIAAERDRCPAPAGCFSRMNSKDRDRSTTRRSGNRCSPGHLDENRLCSSPILALIDRRPLPCFPPIPSPALISPYPTTPAVFSSNDRGPSDMVANSFTTVAASSTRWLRRSSLSASGREGEQGDDQHRRE
jgi:hypothetical protein